MAALTEKAEQSDRSQQEDCTLNLPDEIARRQAQRAESKKPKGREPKEPSSDVDGKAQYNFTDPENLASLRCCLLKIRAQLLTHLSWPEIIERAQADQPFAYQLISNQRLK